MLFNSWKFLIFFPVVTALYFALPHRYRWCLLLLASCAFYMAFIPAYIAILGVTITVDFMAGILIARSSGSRRKAYLIASLVANLGALGFFKYFNFFNDNVAALATLIHWNYPVAALAIALPIGLSFHIFQSLAYTIEVYRERQAPERHFGIFALYVMFYPQLVAGPIERPQNLLHQFRDVHHFDERRVADGLARMGWGLFKKVVIADRVAMIVDVVFGHVTNYSGLTLIVAVVLFAFQIYCDFSGYCDIALGASQVMGFRLMENFRWPYTASSIADFWRRWHISLSTWFKDYLYIPLGGNRVAAGRQALNLFVVFMASGLWHGANWTFVIWGALHGLYLVTSLWTAGLRERVGKILALDRIPSLVKATQIGFTFTLVCFAWIFFRAATMSDAWHVVTHLFVGLGDQLAGGPALDAVRLALGPTSQLVIGVAAIALMEGVQFMQRRGSVRAWLAAKPIWVRWPAYQMMLLLLIFFGVYQDRSFIYFQF